MLHVNAADNLRFAGNALFHAWSAQVEIDGDAIEQIAEVIQVIAFIGMHGKRIVVTTIHVRPLPGERLFTCIQVRGLCRWAGDGPIATWPSTL